MADLGSIGSVVKSRSMWARPVSGLFLREAVVTPRRSLWARPVSGAFLLSVVTRLPPKHTRYVPFYYGSGAITADPCAGKISGTTLANGVAQPYRPVWLFHRPNMVQVRTALSNADGVFEFDAVVLGTRYLLLSRDTVVGTPATNAAVADAIAPAARA